MEIKRGGNGLLLTELLIALLFFSLSAAVCLQLFVASHLQNIAAEDLSRATIEAQNIAECFKASNGNMELTAELLGVPSSGMQLRIYYDEAWSRVHYGSAFSSLLTARGLSEGALSAVVTVYDRNNKVMLEFEVAAVGGAS